MKNMVTKGPRGPRGPCAMYLNQHWSSLDCVHYCVTNCPIVCSNVSHVLVRVCLLLQYNKSSKWCHDNYLSYKGTLSLMPCYRKVEEKMFCVMVVLVELQPHHNKVAMGNTVT